FDMTLSRSMAPLAIDAFWYRLQILRLRACFLVAVRNPRIRIVAEHALVVDDARGALVVRPVVARIHRPIAAFFRIPTKRQLLQRIAARQVKVSPGVVPRTHYEIDLLLLHIGFLTVEAELPAALIILAAPLDHGEVAVRCFVIKRLAWLEIFDHILRVQPVERSPHAGLSEGARDAC